MNLATFRRAVQQKLGLESTSSSTEETLVDAWLNEGVVDVLLKTRCNINCADVALTANEWKYTLDTDILAINDVTIEGTDGTLSSLQRVEPDRILQMRTATPPTSPRVRYYALNGNDLLMLYPTPSNADTLEIFYVPRPTAMSATANDPSAETYGGVPTEYHKAIELYALAQGAEYTDHQPSRYGQTFRDQYEKWLRDIRKAARWKGGRYLGAAQVGRRPFPVPQNSQYPGS